MFFSVVTILIMSFSATLADGIKDAPRRTTQRDSESKTATAGEDVKLTCPIEGTPTPIYEWTKDAELIPEDDWERIRLQGKTLKIKEVTLKDQGTYVCSAINGFGKDTFVTHLNIIDPSSAAAAYPGGVPPEFTQLLPPVSSKVDKPVGHNIKLKCLVSGVPEPTVTWFKDGIELRDGSLRGQSRVTRHFLHLTDLIPEDSGTYTCAAANPVGAAATNWTVRVLDQPMPREPEFYPHDPANTTVVVGEPATFHCRGKSEVTPHVKWLRRFEDGSTEASHIPENETLNWKGHRYIVLQATQVVTPGDGSFYTKLIIPNVSIQDSGVYVCTVTNNFGLAYRQARLSVISITPKSNTFIVLVGFGCIAGIILITVAVVTARRVQINKPPPPPPGMAQTSIMSSPPILPSKLQPSPTHHAHHLPQTPARRSQQGMAHGHAVGPEGAILQYAGGIVHLPPQAGVVGEGQRPQPIIVYQDPASAASVYIAQRSPVAPTASTSKAEYQYQQMDVI